MFSLDAYFSPEQSLLHDGAALILSFIAFISVVKTIDFIKSRQLAPPVVTRKLVHIFVGPVYLLCWNLYSGNSMQSALICSIVPAVATVQFALIGLGVIEDKNVVAMLSRNGDRRDVLKGPVFYGVVFVVITILLWRHSPTAVIALMVLCGGDGLAELFGRAFGKTTIPNVFTWILKGKREPSSKSVIGSAAMFTGGLVFSLVYLSIFEAAGNFGKQFHVWETLTLAKILVTIGASTLVELLPLPEIDNITVPACIVMLGHYLF